MCSISVLLQQLAELPDAFLDLLLQRLELLDLGLSSWIWVSTVSI